jgi:hypothetical protein
VQEVPAVNQEYKDLQDDEVYDEFYIDHAIITFDFFKIVYRGPVLFIDFIKSIHFNDCAFVEFPRSKILLDLVKNLTRLVFVDCGIKSISREDLRGLTNLKQLFIDSNYITRLPKDLFELTPNLEVISFRDNEIKEINAGILDHLENLLYFNLKDNVSIDVEYDNIKGEGNVTLEEFEDAVKKCDPIKKLKAEMRIEIVAVRLEVDQLKNENAASKAEIAELKKENAMVTKDSVELKEKIDNINAEMKEMKICEITVSINSKVLIDENPGADDLNLEHVSEKTFEEILNFMHTKNPPNNDANLLELFTASARLEMKELMDATAEILKENVTPANALDIMNLCKKYPHEELSKKAFIELKKNFPDL